MHSSDELPLHCPQCGERVAIKWGAGALSVQQAIRLQLERNGVFFQCTYCLKEWVIRNIPRLDAVTTSQQCAAASSNRKQAGIASGNTT